jgi:hypothetical protein
MKRVSAPPKGGPEEFASGGSGHAPTWSSKHRARLKLDRQPIRSGGGTQRVDVDADLKRQLLQGQELMVSQVLAHAMARPGQRDRRGGPSPESQIRQDSTETPRSAAKFSCEKSRRRRKSRNSFTGVHDAIRSHIVQATFGLYD